MAIDSRQRRKYQSGGLVASPYLIGTTAADIQLEQLKSNLRKVVAGGETTKKIEGMREELSAKETKAVEEQEEILDEAHKEVIKDAEKAQEKANKNKGFFGSLNFLGSVLNPTLGGLITGLTTGLQSGQRKRALKGLEKEIKMVSEKLKHKQVGLGVNWSRRVSGLNWLADRTKDIERDIASSFKRGAKTYKGGAKEVGAQAKAIDPFKQALMAGLTSFATSKVMGKEGLFSKDAAFTAGTPPSVDPITQQLIPGIAPTKIPFGQRLKKHFIGVPGKYDDTGKLLSGMSKKERLEITLQNLAMYQGMFADDFIIPDIAYTPE